MVSLEGIVTKCSLVRPKIIQSVHYSEKKDRFLSRRYRDQTMTASGATSLNVYPQEDEDKNPVRLNFLHARVSQLILRLAHHRIRILYLHGPPIDLYPRNARKSPSRSTSPQCRRDS